MKVCYFDAFSGISGDMTVGALADAGADQATIIQVLQGLGTGATYHFEKVKRRGIAATKFRVTVAETKRHRHLSAIVKMIEGCEAPQRAKERAISVFENLGRAEASIHEVPIEKVHFHEVGAADSIADIVGACVALELLGIDEIVCSSLNVGSGTVETEHGTLPIPAPATARLLQDKPIYTKGPNLELTTPTGAALATALSSAFGVIPSMKILASGYGAGDHDFSQHANVLRALLGEAIPDARDKAIASSILVHNATVTGTLRPNPSDAPARGSEDNILSKVEEFHGACGVFAVAGYRIGVRALKEFNVRRGNVHLDVTHNSPFEAQWSCIADGIQAATGASPGKLNLRLVEVSQDRLETVISDRRSGERLSFRLQPAFLGKYLDIPDDHQPNAAREVLGLSDTTIFMVQVK
jgi:Protein of unknown function DUF111/FmdE, Molybdenum formylmethanofuran dehydrogenase operon